MTKEQEIEEGLIRKLEELKYSHRPDIRDREALEQNFREKFEALNRVRLTDDEFARLLDEIISPDVFACAEHLRHRNTFEREDGTPLHYQLLNLKDWCKNRFEVVSQLRINTRSSHHRYDVILLINGLPLVQIELKGLAVSPRRAMQQIVEYKHDPGNGYTKSLLCFMQFFIVSNRSERCPPWRAKRRRVVPGSREATRDTRRAEGAKGDPKGASERGVQSYGRPVCSRNELAMLWRNAG